MLVTAKAMMTVGGTKIWSGLNAMKKDVLISKNKLLEEANLLLSQTTVDGLNDWGLLNLINHQKSIPVKPATQGKWLDVLPNIDGGEIGICSNCKELIRLYNNSKNYCPNCGAYMTNY